MLFQKKSSYLFEFGFNDEFKGFYLQVKSFKCPKTDQDGTLRKIIVIAMANITASSFALHYQRLLLSEIIICNIRDIVLLKIVTQ